VIRVSFRADRGAAVSFTKASIDRVTPMSYMAFPNERLAARVLPSNAGFTLLELLTVMTVAAILLTIGVPAFKFVTTANRASSEINGLLGDMQFARAEAIREGQTVTICASSNQLTCLGGGTAWQTGWIVFSDTGPVTGVFGGTDYIVRMQKTFSSQDSLQSDQNINTVTFSRDGFAMSLANPVTFTLHDSTATPQFTRCLSLTIVGALSTQTSGGLTAENLPCN
jgi:type IV fimbrial biogenesis protein FimT